MTSSRRDAPTRAGRLYWTCWVLAVATTGVVAGFMLSHALLLGRYLEWLLASGRGDLLSQTYPVFARSAGRPGLELFYAVAGAQVASAVAFFVVSLVVRRERLVGALVGLAGVLWPAMHYVSGFGALEASVLRSTTEVSREVAGRFVLWNGPMHIFHAATLAAALGALLSVPLSALKARG